MDYRLIAETIKWHAVYSGLNGAEFRVLAYMATSANYKTSRIAASYNELAEVLGLSKVSVSKAVAALVEKKALSVEESAKGRMQTTYRVRSADDLNGYFVQEVNNVEADMWLVREQELFGNLLDRIDDIGSDCDDCQALMESGSNDKCPMHMGLLRSIYSGTDWREYQLWLSDNPKPLPKVKKIMGRTVLPD